MGIRWDLIGLGCIIVALLWVRLEVATQTDSLSYESYLTVRQVDHIRTTGLPLRDDPLSITGAKRVTNPVFDYLLTFCVGFGSFMYKLLPNLFMVLLLVPVYFLAMQVAQSRPAAFVAVVLAGTGPLVFAGYLNTPSSAPIGAFLLLTIIVMLHDTPRYLLWIVGATILLTFISPLIFLLVGALLCIILLLRLEGFGIDRRINELFFFTLLLALWYYIIVYKEAMFKQGIIIVWQNLPAEFAHFTFRNVTFVDAINGLGVVVFLFGALGVYHALFETRERSTYALVGCIFAVLIALLLRVIGLQLGLVLLCVLLSVMACHGMSIMVQYVRRTKFPWAVYPLGALIVFFFILSAVLPALVNANLAMEDAPTPQDIATFRELRETLPPDAVLLTTIGEAGAVQYFSGHVTATDDDFLLVDDGDGIAADVNTVYTARFVAAVTRRAARLGFTHILFSRVAAQEYERPQIFAQGPCLIPQHVGNAILYHVACERVA